jgi:hypothetical protein
VRRDVQPGAVVCLEPGVYLTRSNVALSQSGRPSAPITLTGDGGSATIKYIGAPMGGGVVQTTFCTPWCASHDLVIENLTLDGGNRMNAGVFMREGAHNVTVRNCVIQNTGAAGIAMNAVDHVRAEHNLVYHTGYNQGWSSGISLWYGGNKRPVYGGRTAGYDRSPGFHNYIIGNIVTGAYDNSRLHTDGNGILVDGGGRTPPTLIQNNLSYQNAGAGFSVFKNTGGVWVVGNTAYDNALNLTVGHKYAPEFGAIFSQNVHFVNNLAYSREDGAKYPIGWTYNSTNSSVSWSRNIGFNGKTSGVASAITGDSASYRYVNPMFNRLPPIPAGAAPWARTAPPWTIGDGFNLQTGSPALNWGGDPTKVAGLTVPLLTGLLASLSG